MVREIQSPAPPGLKIERITIEALDRPQRAQDGTAATNMRIAGPELHLALVGFWYCNCPCDELFNHRRTELEVHQGKRVLQLRALQEASA